MGLFLSSLSFFFLSVRPQFTIQWNKIHFYLTPSVSFRLVVFSLFFLSVLLVVVLLLLLLPLRWSWFRTQTPTPVPTPVPSHGKTCSDLPLSANQTPLLRTTRPLLRPTRRRLLLLRTRQPRARISAASPGTPRCASLST